MKKRPLGRVLRLAALTGVALLGACVGDGDDVITTVPVPGAGGTLFTRYVSLGNSITAGFQSGGLTDSLQIRAYPVLLAQRAGGSFESPLVTRTGCPVPMVAPLTASTVAPACARINNPRITGNVAVPGARIADLVRFPSGNTGNLNTLLVGARTQVRAMIEAHPTFVSVWIGNNDALEATLGGILGPRAAGADSSLTPLSAFTTRLNQLVDSIKVANPQGVMLVGVVNAIQAAPLIQPGAYFWLARDGATNRFNGKLVNPNCSPVNLLGQPNPLAANMVSFQIVGDTNFPEINCDPNAYPAGDPRRGAFLLDTSEQAIVAARVAAFNNAIQAAATANNWLYVDPNVILGEYLQETTAGLYQRLRKCQALPAALASGSAAAIQAAVLTSCPVPAAPNFFGSLMSFDGVHPSSEAHRILAGSFAARINARYGTTLSTATS